MRRFGEREAVMKTLVLGLGNLLLQDDGVGVHTVEYLQENYTFPEHVDVLDGGTLGVGLLLHFENVNKLILVDAVEMDAAPGTLIRLEGDELHSSIQLKLSPHQSGIPELLAMAQLQGILPENIILWGVQPNSTQTGLRLSPIVSAQLEVLAENVVREIDEVFEISRAKAVFQ